MLSEARDRHVEDVLREDPERIRRGKRSRNDCPWPSPWESHLSAPSAAVEAHREYVTFFDRLSRDGLSRRTKPSRRANNAQVSGETTVSGRRIFAAFATRRPALPQGSMSSSERYPESGTRPGSFWNSAMAPDRSHPGESNSRPAAYKAAALPAELGWRSEPMEAFGKRVSARTCDTRRAESHFWKS